MSHTPWIPTARRVLVLIALLISLSAATPLLAQQAAGPRPQTPSVQTAQMPIASPVMELSMAQAVAMALETNLGLKRDRLDMSLAAQGIASARAAFLPSLTGGISRNTRTSVPTNQFETTQSISKSSNLTTSATFAQALPWFGSSYRVNMSGGRSATNGFSTFNPTLSSGMTLTFSQPLWQRLKIDSNRFGVESSQRNHQIVDLQLQEQILQTQTAVRLAYLNLVGAIAGVEVAQENKRTNDQALANARARIAVGSAAEIDAIQSEAAVLSSEDAVIVAETRVATSEDVLRNLIVDVARVDFWSVHIVPTDTFRAEPKEIDIEASIKNALDNRLDLQVARRQLELTRLNQDLTRDQTKMALDMTAQYSASGTGGTQIDPNTNLPVTVGFGSVFGDAFGYKNPSWTLGLTFGYPLGQTSARVNLARQQIQIDQATIDLKTQEQNITAQVRDAARQVTSGFRRVQSTQAALAANEKQLEAEQRKLAVGMASTFDVLQRQQLLASAKNAELAARIAYNQALINFERVQRIR